LLIAFAAVGWSTAGLLQRHLSVDTATQIAGRALAAFIVLSVVLLITERGTVVRSVIGIGRSGVAMAACMAAASGLFIFALNHSSVANVLFIQALAPVIAVVLAWLFLHEHPTSRTWVATAVALTGVAVMVGGPGRGSVIGLVAAGLMTIGFSVTIVIARHRREISMLPALALAQLMLVVAVGWKADIGSIGAADFGYLALIGTVQMAMSQMCFAAGARLISAAEVALLTLLEVVLGPLWVWLFLHERPAALTLAGGAIVLAAVAYQATEPATTPEDHTALVAAGP
jgi:drug/metabolite transporter (DMT)-like permease